jgi:transcriptional regulator with XRE-family HTH domain
MNLDDLLERKTTRRRLPAPDVRRLLRERAGLTQTEAGEFLAVLPSTVSRWESGQRTPRGDRLDRYLQLLERLRQVAG